MGKDEKENEFIIVPLEKYSEYLGGDGAMKKMLQGILDYHHNQCFDFIEAETKEPGCTDIREHRQKLGLKE